MARKKYFSILICIAALGITACAGVAGSQHNAKGVNLLKKSQVEAAFAEFEKAYQESPNNPYTLNNMGYVQEMKYQNYTEAARLYQKAIEKAEAERTKISISDNRRNEGKPLAEIARQNLARVQSKLKK